MDRYWLVTWTTYGTWLPGDERGFVSGIRNPDREREVHNQPGTEYDRKNRGIALFAQRTQKAVSVRLTSDQAVTVCKQIQATAVFRKWKIGALAVMATHVHVVVGVPDDPEPETVLRDFKTFASRELNRLVGSPQRWWTQSGSTRKLPDEAAIASAIRYVQNQEHSLATYFPEL